MLEILKLFNKGDSIHKRPKFEKNKKTFMAKYNNLTKWYSLDEILDLISENGLGSLTKEQLKQLHYYSKNI